MMPGIFRRLLGRGAQAPGWLAFDFSERGVGVAHVRVDAGRPVVQFAEEREWDAAEPKSLARVAAEFDAHRFRCTTLLRAKEYNLLLVEAPKVKPEELKAAMRWRIKDMLDYHVDDATIDVLDVPAPPNAAARAHYMYTVTSRTETVRDIANRFEAAKIPLSVIDIPETAQRNVAAYFEADQRGLLALTFDDQGGLLTVNFAGELYLSRRLEVTGGDFVEADVEGRNRLLERVLVETQRSLDHCERTYPFFSLGRVVLGPVPEEIGLREHLSTHLYLPVEALDLGRVAQLPAAEDWSLAKQARWLKLIGAGLRVEKKAL
jgi:MSHA biogenesis protein MshI